MKSIDTERRCAMDFRPIEAIRAVSPVNLNRPADGVAPPFAIDGSVPMGDDSCDERDSEQERDLEKDNIEERDDEEQEFPGGVTEEPAKIVNLFA